jgi:hypothetical protein
VAGTAYQAQLSSASAQASWLLCAISRVIIWPVLSNGDLLEAWVANYYRRYVMHLMIVKILKSIGSST